MAKKKAEEIIKSNDDENLTDNEDIKEAEVIEETGEIKKAQKSMDGWSPKTSLGKRVKNLEIKEIDEIIDSGMKIMEEQIVDALLPELNTELLLIGQAKGKFGGGQRRVFKQTQKKTQEGNKPKFATFAVVGNNNGYVGLGYGKAKETVPAREKALRNAKLAIMKIRRGCGSWECGCKEPHSIPFSVKGKCGSVEIELLPAPKGTGLKVEKETQKILKIAGIKDVWSKSKGQLKSKINLIYAIEDALKKLMNTKVNPAYYERLGIKDGKVDVPEKELELDKEEEKNEQ